MLWKPPYLSDRLFLKELDELTLKEIFVRIILLDINDQPLEEIQGRISTGQINIDSSSALRRAGSLTFIPNELEGNLTDLNKTITIEKRIQLEIGYKNTLNQYIEYDIIWFPLGVYIITDVSMDSSSSGVSISLTIQDKMCLLNGTCGGTIPAAAELSTIETVDSSGTILIEYIPIYNIIQELVSHYGEEELSKIIISDIDLRAKQVVRWTGDDFLYLYDDSGTLRLSINEPGTYLEVFSSGDNIGYQFTDLTWPDSVDLVADAGKTVYDILDTIKNMLGNYEFFYDLDGNFVFQEIKNYLNTSEATTAINRMTSSNYLADSFSRDGAVYDFNNRNLITSFSNTPQYSMIKNDFTVWGIKTITSETNVPIRYHLAIDKKPTPMLVSNGNKEDWRNVLYRQGIEAETLGLNSNVYYPALKEEWPKLYNTTGFYWKENVLANPSTIDYFLDFIDTSHSMNELSVNRIGRRSKVIVDNDVNCIFAPDIPDLIITEEGNTIEQAEAQQKGMRYCILNSSIEDIKMGDVYKDAFSVVRDMLYENTSYNTSITLQTIPIYYLDVNTRINVFDNESGINGDFMIRSISVPLSISETMSISATIALERI